MLLKLFNLSVGPMVLDAFYIYEFVAIVNLINFKNIFVCIRTISVYGLTLMLILQVMKKNK